jgi:uncharacterized protein (TIGR02266 family)
VSELHVTTRTDPRPDERRGDERVALEVDVSLYSETQFFAGLVEDVSEGGLFVATFASLPLGTEIDLVFTLPTGHEVRTRGAVRWLRSVDCETSPGIGVQFEDLRPIDAAAISTFLRHRPALVWDPTPL